MERKGEERKQALGQLCLPSGISIEQLGHSAFRQFTSFVQRAIIRVNWKEKKETTAYSLLKVSQIECEPSEKEINE